MYNLLLFDICNLFFYSICLDDLVARCAQYKRTNASLPCVLKIEEKHSILPGHVGERFHLADQRLGPQFRTRGICIIKLYH